MAGGPEDAGSAGRFDYVFGLQHQVPAATSLSARLDHQRRLHLVLAGPSPQLHLGLRSIRDPS